MKKTIACLLTLILLAGIGPLGRAFTMPQVTMVGTLDELLAWYAEGGGTCQLTTPVVVDRPVTLDGDCLADIGVLDAPIQIAAGGSLTIDNENASLAGPAVLVEVAAGGELHLLAGGAYSGLTQDVIGLAEGAVYQRSEGFILSWEEASSMLPPVTTPTPAPITDLRGEIRKIENGAVSFYMTLPRMEMQTVTALRIQRSGDGQTWEDRDLFLWDAELNYMTAGPDSRAGIQFGTEHTYVSYTEDTDYRDFYLRVEVEGTPFAGTSNAVKVVIPADAKPGESLRPPTTDDYEDNSGNRGGGGQGVSDRVELPSPTPEPTPTPTPTPEPTPTPTPEPTPTATPTPVPTVEVTPTPSAQPTPVPQPSQPPSVPAAVAVLPTTRPSPTPVAAPSPTATATPTPTPTATATPEPTPTAAPSPTPSALPKPSAGSGDMVWVAGGLTLAALGGGGAYLFLKRKP